MKNNTLKKILFVITSLLLITVIAFTVFMVVNQYSFDDLALILERSNITDVGVITTIGFGDRNFQVATTNNYIYVINPYKVLIYDKVGRLIKEEINEFESPTIASNQLFVILYDEEHQYYERYQNGKKEQTYQVGNIAIINTSSKNFISIILTGGEGFNGQVITTDMKNQTSSSVKFANLYPISSVVLKDSEYYAVSLIDASSIDKMTLEVYSLYEEQVLASCTIDQQYYLLRDLSDQLFFVIGQKGFAIYQKTCELVKVFDGQVIDVKRNEKYTYIAFIQNGKNYVTAFEENGQVVFTISIDYAINGIGCGYDQLAVFGESTISLFDSKGKETEELLLFSLIGEVSYVDSSIILVTGIDDMVLYKFK